MTKYELVQTAELEQARKERDMRKQATATYKEAWRQEKYAADPVGVRAERAAYQRKWRAANRDRARAISREASSKYNRANPSTKRQSGRQYQTKRRREVLEFLGCRCVRCGYSDVRALHVDHIHGDGYKERKTNKGNHTQWKLISDNPQQARERYQLLCANCNHIKRLENYEMSRKQHIARILDNE